MNKKLMTNDNDDNFGQKIYSAPDFSDIYLCAKNEDPT